MFVNKNTTTRGRGTSKPPSKKQKIQPTHNSPNQSQVDPRDTEIFASYTSDQAPSHGNQAPFYGHQAPSHGNQAPFYGHQAPPHSHQAPFYGFFLHTN